MAKYYDIEGNQIKIGQQVSVEIYRRICRGVIKAFCKKTIKIKYKWKWGNKEYYYYRYVGYGYCDQKILILSDNIKNKIE